MARPKIRQTHTDRRLSQLATSTLAATSTCSLRSKIMRFSINTTTTWTCSLIKSWSAKRIQEEGWNLNIDWMNSKLISGADSWLTRQNGFLMWITKWQQEKINESDILSKLFWSLNMRTYYCYSCLKVIEYPHCFNLLLLRSTTCIFKSSQINLHHTWTF